MSQRSKLQEVVESIPPCRILKQNGQDVDILVTERKALRDCWGRDKHVIEVPTPKPAAKPAPVPKEKREKRAPAWNHNDHVTPGVIGALMSRGLTPKEIAVELKCSTDTVYLRLRLAKAERSRIAAHSAERGAE